ncbi:MAG: CRISPR-associated protein Csm6 [Lachnospiraceae bacterium]|nr:CRISPR-associated protein Csm6 [Lachnospiraceae bacterium]
MSKKILFSSIGGNDPVSSTTESDGSMLHICRVYKPDIVYLYLSKEMVDRHRQDDRYRYCINKLGEILNHTFEIRLIERENLIEVQDYDYYYEDFRNIVREIEKEMESEDILLANIASGTPAMKSALLFLATISNYKFLPIQVSTPSKSIMEHKGKDLDYDVEYYWEINKDNEVGWENRCKEIVCPNLVTLLKKDIIKKHINSYDYAAALSVAEEIKENISNESYQLLVAAVKRLQLDLPKAMAITNKIGVDIIPVKESNHVEIFEYALAMKIKIEHRQYGDFIRAISPIITDLFELILKEQCKINVHDYCNFKKGIWSWSIDKLNKDDKGKEILKILNNEFSNKGGLRDKTIIYASNLKPLLEHYLKDERLINNVVVLRNIEEKVRNIAAHEIVSITDEKLSKLLDMPIQINKIFSLIKSMVVAAKIRVTEKEWQSYDEMNRIIEKMLD